MRTFIRSTAAASVAALALTACGGGGTTSSDPATAVAEGIQARFDEGFSFALDMTASEAALAAMSASDPSGAEAFGLLADGFVSGAFRDPGQFALSLGDFFELRIESEALYLRLDLAALNTFAQTMGEDAFELPPPSELEGMLGFLGLGEDVEALALAALAGEWIGVTGITEEAAAAFTDSFGMSASEDDAAKMQDVLRDAGLLDGAQLTERYLEVSGADGSYDVTVKARDLMAALAEVTQELESLAGSVTTTDLPDLEDVPEAIAGFQVTVSDGKATSMSADIVAVANSVDATDADLEGLDEGDVVISMTMDDVGDRLGAPDGAVTITFDELAAALAPLLGSLMGGGLGA